MNLNKENILSKTHYGLNIYAYVLRQYYPQSTLQVVGKAALPTRNPFNLGKQTLHISVENGMAVHTDIEQSLLSGDVFEFANLHFKAESREVLYYLLNQVMHLGLIVEPINDLAWLDLEDDTWYPKTSFFEAPIRNVFPKVEMTLAEVHSLITGQTYQGITTVLRSLSDPKEKRIFKANHFPYVTFSGTFKKRGDKYLIKHSNLLAIDFDDLPDVQATRHLLLEDEYIDTELLFISPSGKGLKWIIRLEDDPMNHTSYYDSVEYYLKITYNLEIDANTKDVSRASFLAHDPDAVLHRRHRPLSSHQSNEDLSTRSP